MHNIQFSVIMVRAQLVRLIVSAMLISYDTVFFSHNKTASPAYKPHKRSSEQVKVGSCECRRPY